ncbi:hypothetical protein GCM10027082_12910 [Comamonas humi]
MSSPHTAATTPPSWLSEETDLRPLAWVRAEVRRALEGAVKALRRHLHDLESSQGGDLEAVDPAGARFAKQQLHTIGGALVMVGMDQPARLVEAMETVVQRFAVKPELCTPQAVAVLEKSSFALVQYLDHLLKARSASFVSLFPQYRDVQALAGVERLHPADLWRAEPDQAEPATPAVHALAVDAATRSRMDAAMLPIIKSADAAAALDLTAVCLGIAQGRQAQGLRLFWKVTAGFFEGLAHRLIPADLYTKRTASRVLLQYAALAKGREDVDAGLLHELNFFCALAQPDEGQASGMPVLAAVRQTLPVAGLDGVHYAEERYGLYDPAVLAQARKRVDTAAELWASLADGDRYKIKPVGDQFHLIRESLHKLRMGADELGAALGKVAEHLTEAGTVPSTSLGMEVATAILYLQANLDAMDATPDATRPRAGRLAERLQRALAGHEPEPLEAWVEELYRKVSDHQTMGSVVDELRNTLGEVEQRLDQYFRHPDDVSMLGAVTGLMSQIRGVLSVLGLDQAAAAMQHFRGVVDQLAANQISEAERPAVFDRLGNSLGALGFMLDMLGYQRTLARKLFVFDEVVGELRISMGVQKEAEDASPQATVPAPLPPAAAAEPVAPAREAQAEAPAPVVIDEELLGIFLEEAKTVVDDGSQALRALRRNPSDAEALTTVRRSFHTLKGSSRMVGLEAYGEAAWAMEQLLNTWLAEHKPVSEPLLALSREALQGLGSWAEDIGSQAQTSWNPAMFRTSADAMRVDGRHVPLAVPESARVDLVAPTQIADLEPAELPADPPAAVLPELVLEWPLEAVDLELEPAPSVPDDVEADLPEPALALAEEVDFDAFAQALDAASAPAETAVEAMDDEQDWEHDLAPTMMLALPDLELPPMRAESESAPVVIEVLAEPEVPAVLPMVEPVSASTQDGGEVVSADVVPADVVESAQPGDTPAQAPEAEVPQSLVQQLGISPALYSVYLGEAEEWSRALEKSLHAWAERPERMLPDEAIAYAHSLAGSSATVGFQPLSELARALEHALLHVQHFSSPDLFWLNTFQAAGSDIRKLLHQFAAGFVKPASESVLEDLQTVLAAPVDSGLHPPYGLAALQADEVPEPILVKEPPPPVPKPVAAPAVAVAAPSQPAAKAPPAPQPEAPPEVPMELAPALADVDAVDVIDPDLFLIFDEEAQELLPRLASALREWAADPQHVPPRAEVLRHLHTLKGSARLAGAMRLGEMAHRMESAVEEIDTERASSPDVEPLLVRFDALQAEFQLLQKRGTQVVAQGLLPQPAPVALVDAADGPAEVQARATAELPAMDEEGAAPGVTHMPVTLRMAPVRVSTGQTVRVRSQLLDRLLNEAGEVLIARSRLDMRVVQMRSTLKELATSLERLRSQLRDLEVQAESQMQSRLAQSKDADSGFDPLEFDRFTRVQELTRMMAESVGDVAAMQRNLLRTAEGAEDDLTAQGRQARELQRDLLRTRMVEFDSVSERLYAIVRQVSKELGKQVKLEIFGGAIEMDRGVLDRVMPAFEHLLRNCVAHGIEGVEDRARAGKPAAGKVEVEVRQEGNDISVSFRDDGAGLNVARIQEKAVRMGLIDKGAVVDAEMAASLIYAPGFSTASEVTGVAGRGIGMDVVRAEVQALGGNVVTTTDVGRGSTFRLVMPLTTAVTQVVMVRAGKVQFGVPANMVEYVRRVPQEAIDQAHDSRHYAEGNDNLPFYYAGALLQGDLKSQEKLEKTSAVVILRSAAQRVALHVDEVLGNQEVVVKHLGLQLARLPGLAGMSVLASGAVVLIYNPVALHTVYGERVLQRLEGEADTVVVGELPPQLQEAVALQTPLVLVVDDSITVRRVTQRLLQREGYRVALAADGLQALDRLGEERPVLVLSDIEMPRMDGFELLREIRGDGRLSGMPVVMITSRIADKHREHAMSLGANHYLGKPYSDEVLLGLVRQYALQRELQATEGAA